MDTIVAHHDSTQKCGIHRIIMRYYCIMKVEYWVLVHTLERIFAYIDAKEAEEEKILVHSKNEWSKIDHAISAHYDGLKK